VKRVILFLSLVLLVSLTAMGAGTVTLTFSDWHLTEPVWEQSLKEAVAAFEAENPDIKVQLDYVSYGEKETKYTTAIEAGVGPDVMHLHAYSLRSFIEKGYLLDLTSFIEAEGATWYGADFLDPWYEATLQFMEMDGHYYALPGDFMAMVLFYNSELFKEAGLDPDKPPTTWAEFREYAKKLTRDRDGDGKIDTWGFGTPALINPGWELRFSPILFAFGADYLTPDNKFCALNTPEAIEAMKFYVELYTVDGVMPPGVTAVGAGNAREQMAREQVAMVLGCGWTPPIVNGINPDLNAFQILRAVPLPVKAGIDAEYTTTAWLSSWMINKNTKHPEEAWKLLKFITDKAQEEKWFRDNRVQSSRKDVSGGLEDPCIKGYNELLCDPFSKVIAAELTNAKFVPQIKEWPEIIEIVNIAAQEGLTGQKTVEAALKNAYDRINEILSVYREPGEACPPF